MTTKNITAQDLFKNIELFVADSRALLGQGATVELAGLDEQVQNLCNQVLKLSQDDRLEYADLLQKLLGELTLLGEDMLKQKDAVANEIRYLSSHKKASVAYKVADATEGKKDDE